MKNWIIAAIAIVLVLNIVTGGFLYDRLSNEMNRTQSEIATLKLAVLSSPAGGQTTPTTVSGGTTMTMGDLISMIQPVIVRVDVTSSSFKASGSGIIIRSNGYVITNGTLLTILHPLRLR